NDDPATHLLTVTFAGAPARVFSDVAGLDCTATCSQSFTNGSTVTLGTDLVGYSADFVGWSGACSGTGTCTLAMSANRAVTATFAARPLLTVTKTGSGSGTVTSLDGGINCGATCSADYSAGLGVHLDA